MVLIQFPGFDKNSMVAHAIERPSKVLVPLPISSSMIRLRSVAFLRIFASSLISM